MRIIRQVISLDYFVSLGNLCRGGTPWPPLRDFEPPVEKGLPPLVRAETNNGYQDDPARGGHEVPPLESSNHRYDNHQSFRRAFTPANHLHNG